MPKKIVILGGGVGGTIAANLLNKRLKDSEAEIALVDSTGKHLYLPGLLYIPFRDKNIETLVRDESELLGRGIKLITDTCERIQPADRTVHMKKGDKLTYDYLVIASGATLHPEVIPGLVEGGHHFYDPPSALRLREALSSFTGGRILIGVASYPIRCPPAPLEAAFFLDYMFRRAGIREKVDLEFFTPLDKVHPMQSVAEVVEKMFNEREIGFTLEDSIESLDYVKKTKKSENGEMEHYDLLITIPTHRGSRMVEESELGDEDGWIPTDEETLRVNAWDDVYALGDATDIPTCKAGSTAHYQAPVVTENIKSEINGTEPEAKYDGKVIAFFETAFGKAMYLKFDYENPPLSLKPRRVYHWAKVLFNSLYWSTVAKGRL
jgi:sulfide:quinone oxidoreductase